MSVKLYKALTWATFFAAVGSACLLAAIGNGWPEVVGAASPQPRIHARPASTVVPAPSAARETAPSFSARAPVPSDDRAVATN